MRPTAPIRERAALAAPNTLAGQALGALFLALVVGLLSFTTQSDESSSEIVVLALVFAVPMLVVVRHGHFGVDRWCIPTPGGFMFAFWQLGLSPSMVAVGADAPRFCSFSEDAVLATRGVYFTFMLVFALALGRGTAASVGSPRAPIKERAGAPSLSAAFALLVIVWALATVTAWELNLLSYWNAAPRMPSAGSVEMTRFLFYLSLTALMPSAAVFVYLQKAPYMRAASIAVAIVSIIFVFILSSRRQWMISGFLCFSVLQTFGRRPPLRWIMVSIAVSALAMGPLLWSYRILAHAERRDGTLDVAATAVEKLIVDEEMQRASWDRGKRNLEMRLGIAATTYCCAQYVMDRSPHFGGTFLSGFVRVVPTVVWSEKNALADDLEVRWQLLRTGRFPPVDIAVSPVTEFIFDFGLFVAPLGGLLYGWLARLANRLTRRAATSLHGWVLWASFVATLCFFDAGTFILPTNLREPLLVALLLGAISLMMRRWRPVSGAACALRADTRAAIRR